MQPSLRNRRSLRGSPEHRLSIKGFLPLPPIASSPICTPTSAMVAGEALPTSTPAEDVHLLRVLPTWIAIPPTPPGNHIRRSVTCVTPSSPLSPSVSCPAPPTTGSHCFGPRRPRALSDPLVQQPITSLYRQEDVDESQLEKAKDDIRRFHALMELLATEVSYLADLRILFSVYLRHLPTLCRTQSTFSLSPSRNSSTTHLPKTMTTVLSDQGLNPLTSISTKPKSSARPLFTSREVDILARNVEQVLQLHENFVQELCVALSPFGFTMESDPALTSDKPQIHNLDDAISVVSTKFATEASRFDAYQTFCSGHPEALVLIHRVQTQYAGEWEAFEQQCALVSLNMTDLPEASSPEAARSHSEGNERSVPPSIMTVSDRKRTRSLTSIEGARKAHSRTNSKDSSGEGRHRLAFLDYMIKPIQRICRYPLLLDQLRPGAKLRQLGHPFLHAHVNVVVESATKAMRHVASAVDEARHRQNVQMQSSLIISRITLAHPTMATSHMAAMNLSSPTFQILTPSFLSSLGICLLAGSLDVMHYQSSKPTGSGINVNAKYLGAFLYLGGYLILVKVSKNKYEPRHWFPLADFDVIEQEEEDTSLPCTFSLIYRGHQFDLTAACQREKDVWLTSIRESRLHPPEWINEPTSSLHLDGKGEMVPSTLDEPYEIINPLPTIQSLPELAQDDDHEDLKESVLAVFRNEVAVHSAVKVDMPNKAPEVVTSRRSSSASVAAKLTANSDGDTIIIRRSSPAARSLVDQGLQDVVSEPIVAARFGTRDELFQAPRILRISGSGSGFSRSNSALSLTSLTKNRLSKHESVRVPRRRSAQDDPPVIPSKKATSLRGPPRRRPQRLTIMSASEAESIFQPISVSSSPFSQSSSIPSTPTSPTTLESPFELRTRSQKSSLTSNTSSGGSRSVSPTTTTASQHSKPSMNTYKTMTQGIRTLWTKGSRHRRTRSIPSDENMPEMSSSPLPPPTLSLESPTTSPVTHSSPTPSRTLSRNQLRILSTGAPMTPRHSFSNNNTELGSINKRSSIFKRLKGLSA
ncbi:DH domain-containing protein [Mycena indigotica]|uniref:DH domain-containing protein n=1 Tax=Mycena indigotica TaxID=2126181 RepID=A0A8H6W4U2_9AGAR|nr:DH domain-containing protein [Mycena indigotica]KAF7301818.1 DH domain-containing protein [Mycena indigotica]